jgi:drug/metabolite transporter (DMT)-like permease
VVIALLPAATAVMAVLRGGEHPSPAFWAACGFGAITVAAFAFTQGGGGLRAADGWLLAAVALAAIAYAEGGTLARELGGWQVICWALVIAAPIVVPIAATNLVLDPPQHPSPGAWVGLAYVSAISMFGGFFAWYRGLALGGIAKISQLQLAQPVLTLTWAALLLGEHVDRATVATGALVIVAAVLTQRSRAMNASATPAACGGWSTHAPGSAIRLRPGGRR